MTRKSDVVADGSGIVELPATQARYRMSELIDFVQDGEFVYLTRRGKRVAALMPADIAEHYEQMEDEYWARQAQAVLDRESHDDALPMEKVFAALELADPREVAG